MREQLIWFINYASFSINDRRERGKWRRTKGRGVTEERKTKDGEQKMQKW